MTTCTECGSSAINQTLHGREPGVDLHLCDVCYWRIRAQPAEEVQRDRLLAAVERAAKAETALRRLVDECENDTTTGWEDRMRDCIADAQLILKATP